MPKYVFVTGGVVSSLGKGIVAASIGLLIKSRGLTVAYQKMDPYLNIDPGTMNPIEHGEVYVTEDGAETDLDLGYYERFTGVRTNRNSSFSAGKIYDIILKKERKGGEYFGKTVQVVPHVVNEIQNAIRSVGNENIDVVIVEIGGTVGDIESFPFLEALRLFRQKEGYKNVYFVHVSLVPYLHKAEEIKTKPTQHSVARLREIGIIPNMLVCRTEIPLAKDVKEKLGMFCNVDVNCVVESLDFKHTIYECPIMFSEQDVDVQILEHFGLKYENKKIDEWYKYIKNITQAKKKITIAVVGKYTQVPDAYKSIKESLEHAAAMLNSRVVVKWVNSETLETQGVGDLSKAEEILKEAHGVLVPGGFGDRGIEGKIIAARYSRERNVPFLGICLGMQITVIEYARNVLGYSGACSHEVDENGVHRMIVLMDSQKQIVDKGGTMRLGAYSCKLLKDSLAYKLYGEEEISERHRHRYEFNNEYREELTKKGLVFSGLSPDEQLVEIVELKNHPFFVGVQFHPEFKSRPIKPHPLFIGFIEAALKK
ncbi:MAG: CTP synthase [Chitinispirillales bacterium]|jgi:CTP synthase|nr:CTP synthase [Chitinispirillales bacterium]